MSIFFSLLLSHPAWAEPSPLVVGDHTFWIDTLGSGLQAIAVEDPGAEAASVFVVYSVGLRMEDAEHHGIAHLTEHAAFSGTETAPMGALIAAVEARGGEANAYTRDDFTVFYDHRVPTSALPEVLALEADRMRGVAFFPDAFAEEQRRLTVEESHANLPTLQLQERRRFAVYGGQAYGAGTFDDAGNTAAPGLSAEQVRRFYDRWYQPSRASVVIVGPPHEQSLGLISAAFAPILPSTETPDHQPALGLVLPEPGEVSFQTGLSQRRVEWVWSGPSLADTTDRLSLELLASLLDEQTAEALIDGTVGSSLFVLAATGEGAEEALASLCEVASAAAVSAEALAQGKALLRERYHSRSLRSRPYFSLAVDVAVAARWDLAEHPARFAERVDALTLADLQAAARRWLRPERRWTITYLPDAAALAELPEDRKGLAEAAVAATESGDLLRAIAAYERLLGLGADPMNTVIYRYTLGELNYRLRRYDEARRQLEAGLAVIEYPALRELLEEVEAAADGTLPADIEQAPRRSRRRRLSGARGGR